MPRLDRKRAFNNLGVMQQKEIALTLYTSNSLDRYQQGRFVGNGKQVETLLGFTIRARHRVVSNHCSIHRSDHPAAGLTCATFAANTNPGGVFAFQIS